MGLAGAAMLYAHARKTGLRLAAVVRTPTSSIASAPREGMVEIGGRVVPGEQGTIVAPITGKEAVYVRVLVERVVGSSRETVLDDVQTRPFLVDDGTGTALVHMGAKLHAELAPSPVAGGPEEHARVTSLLAARGKDATGVKKLVWKEWLVAPGSSIYVLGSAEAQKVGPSPAGYRDRPDTGLALTAPPPGSSDEMIVSTYAEAELQARLRVSRGLILFGVVVSLVTGVGGALYLATR
jgi:hypothetical protein